MKNIIKNSGFLLLLAVLFSGCEEKIELTNRDYFIATYSVTETWVENGNTITKAPFTMYVTLSYINEDGILLSNFANYGAGVTAESTKNGFNMTIKQQTLPNLKVITGTGKLDDPTLNFTYTETFNSISTSITAVAKKK